MKLRQSHSIPLRLSAQRSLSRFRQEKKQRSSLFFVPITKDFAESGVERMLVRGDETGHGAASKVHGVGQN